MKLTQILPRIRKRYLRYKDFSRNREIIAKNSILAGTKTGKTCFIIGNGPSLKNQDLKLLADKETFVVNSFWLHPEYKYIRPKYYVVIDTPPDISDRQPGQPLEMFAEDLPGRNPVVSD